MLWRCKKKMHIQVCLLALLGLQYARGQSTSAVCMGTKVPGKLFEVVFRYDRAGDTAATGLQSYEAQDTTFASPVPLGSVCDTSTVNADDIFTLSYTVDAGPSVCGVYKVGATNEYKVVVKVIGLDSFYTFSCESDNLGLGVVVTTSVNTGHANTDGTIEMSEGPFNCDLYAVIPTQNTPVVDSVRIGTPIKLRLTYDTSSAGSPTSPTSSAGTYGPNLFGSSFHASVIPMAGVTTITLQVSTMSATPVTVDVTGQLAGSEINFLNNAVTRTAAYEVTIPVAYMPDSTLTNWVKKTSGIKIVSTGGEVGVRITMQIASSEVAAYIVYPDSILKTTHRIPDYGVNNEETVVVIATEDATTVTIGGSYPALLTTTIDGVQRQTSITPPVIIIDGVLGQTSVTLNEYETLALVCGTDCTNIDITSDKNIAVISGSKIPTNTALKAGYAMHQIPPVEYLDTDFVQFKKSQSNSKNAYYTTSAFGTTASVTNDVSSGVYEIHESRATNDPIRVRADTPLYAYTMTEFGVNYQSFTYLPGVRQWSTSHYYYLKAGVEYNGAFVATTGDTQNIQVITSTTTTLTGATGNQDPVLPLSGNPTDRTYEEYVWTITPPSSDMYEFRAPDHKRFLLIINEKTGSGGGAIGTGMLSFGVTFPTINPCPQVAAMTAGDGVDNDCDGVIDEEVADGQDTDFDFTIDEDIGAIPDVDPTIDALVRVTTLYISDNPTFADPYVRQLHTDGCNTINSASIHSTVGPFVSTNELATSDPNLWVMDTSVFRAYRFRELNTVYFRVEYEACFGGPSYCANSCTALGRKKRASEQRHVDMQLGITNGNSTSSAEKDCESNVIYWAPHVMLLLIIILEAAFVGYMMYLKFNLKRKMN